jgi:hypothetical protein
MNFLNALNKITFWVSFLSAIFAATWAILGIWKAIHVDDVYWRTLNTSLVVLIGAIIVSATIRCYKWNLDKKDAERNNT